MRKVKKLFRLTALFCLIRYFLTSKKEIFCVDLGITAEENIFFLKKVWWKRNFALSLHSQSGRTERGNASLAQLVEHDTLNVGVQGSSP